MTSNWIEGDSLAPPCQADTDVVNAILELASPYLSKDSFFFDLGCGDGRICIAATEKYGCRSLGVEIEENEILKFEKAVAEREMGSLVSIVHGDLREIDLAPATVISIYLLPEAVAELTPAFTRAIENGTILIFNTWAPKSFTPAAKSCSGFANNVDLKLCDRSSLPPSYVVLAADDK